MRFLAYVLVSCALMTGLAHAAEIIRPPAVAGALYPADEKTLRETMQKYYDAVTVQPPNERLLGCIVPHSGYGLCGKEIASAFKELKPGQYDRVIILAPSHFAQLMSCSIPSVHAFVTPLDLILLDDETIDRMCYSPYFELQALHRISRRPRPHVHEPEYSIEVLLPFLRERLGNFKLIPVLVGDILDSSGKRSEQLLDSVAATIRRAMDERTLLIASSDLTPYGGEFGYRPFTENPLDGVEKLDREAIDYMVKGDYEGFHEFLKRTQDPICGRQAIDLFLRVLPEGTEGCFLSYEQSGRLMKVETNSLGFAAINFYNPSLPPLEPKPVEKADPAFESVSAASSGEPSAEPAKPDAAAPVAPPPAKEEKKKEPAPKKPKGKSHGSSR